MFLKCLVILVFCGFNYALADRMTDEYYHSYERCPYPHLEHGMARVKQRLNFVRFSCRARYILMGNKYATCRGGSWDLPPPICIKSGCDPLPEVKNSVIQSNHNNSWVLFFCFPGHKLVGSPVLYCDGRNWNSTVPQCVDSSAQPKTSCDFEDPDLCGWKQDELHDFDWRRLNKRTPSSFLLTGPQFDHTFGKNGHGYYMYIESTSRATNDTARLISPVMDEHLARNGCFAFYYHMYGRHIGGLRVYQKPEKLSMYKLLNNSENGKNKYILFEQWGNQGNVWFTSVSPLLDLADDFQIVIEGIRGRSFMSDIAIDDVAILQGENCTVLTQDATTPLSTFDESCVGRCGTQNGPSSNSCDCSIMCLVSDNCCPDYLDVCEFGANNNGSDEIESSTFTSTTIQLPQTQKLVATTTSSIPTTTSTSTTTSTTSTSTSTTTSTTSTTTTRKPTSTSTTQRTTPTYRTTSTTKLTTTTTTPKPTSIRITTEATNAKKKSTPSVIFIKTSPVQFVYTLKPPTTQMTLINFTLKPPVSSNRIVQKKPQGASGVTIAVIVVLVMGLCSGLLYGGYLLRTARGTSALARLRGRTTSDPEVRFLKADVDIGDDE